MGAHRAITGYAADAGLPERIQLCAERIPRGDTLSRATGIPQSNLTLYKVGKSEPKVGAIVKIARAARVRIAWLAAGEGAMESGVSPVASSKGLDQLALARSIAEVDMAMDRFGSRLIPEKRAFCIAAAYAFLQSVDVHDEAAFRRFMQRIV